MIAERTIQWSPLTQKHKDYIKSALKSRMSIAEGAIRSGKTIDHCIITAVHLEICRDRIHLATGSTVRNAKLNIGDCNGFGLEYLFRGRCRWGKYKDNEALLINTQTGEKIVIFAGGGKADSYKGILGNSYGLWIATEINEHYLNVDDSQRSFIHVAFGRQAAAKEPITLWDLNPSNPNADIYEHFINPYSENSNANYQHFTLFDNGSLSQAQIDDILSRYIPGTIWHSRDILGERCVADGLIYRYFADNVKDYFIEKEKLPRFMMISVGADWGGNKSYHSFCAVGITHDYKIYALWSERHEAKDTDADFVSQKFNRFIASVEQKYGPVDYGYGDSEGQTLKNTVSNKGKIRLRNSIKNPIKERIDATMLLIAQRRFFYTEDCDSLVKALSTAVWDIKHPDERLDNGTSDIDTLDSFEYSWERHIRHVTQI